MRYAKHFDKDLYSKWHRLWDGIAMCDVDSVEICRNKGCWQPLALIEHVYDTGNYKKYTNVIKSLGLKADHKKYKYSDLRKYMKIDKKVSDGQLNLILIDKNFNAFKTSNFNNKNIIKALN